LSFGILPGTIGESCISESSGAEVEYDPSTHVCCGGWLSVRAVDEGITEKKNPTYFKVV